MKKLFLIPLLAFMTGCASKNVDNFTLSGNISGVEDGEEIYLSRGFESDEKIDTAKIENGVFSFSGTIKAPEQVTLFMGKKNDRMNKRIAKLYLEPTVITVELDSADFGTAQVTGSPVNDESVARKSVVAQLKKKQMEMYEAAYEYAESDSVKFDSMMHDVFAFNDSIREFNLGYAKRHPDSYISPECIMEEIGNLNYNQIKESFEALNPEIQDSYPPLKNEFQRLAAIQPGQPAPEVKGIGPDGTPISLSDLKGKIVLLDFWATWCGPCRASFPHLKEVYEKYSPQGLEVLCVASDDLNVDGWKEAIGTLGISNFHHILEGLVFDEDGIVSDRSNAQSYPYVVHYIPTKFLIDRDGKIIGRFDNDKEALDAKLTEIFD